MLPFGSRRAIVDCSASLVGKLLTKRGFSRAALKDTMWKVWGSPEGLQVVDVEDNLFHFCFSNEMDLQRVVNGGPWCFDNMVLLLCRWETENSYGPWTAAAPSFRRGYRWKGRDDEPLKRWRGEGGNTARLTKVTFGGILTDAGVQLSGKHGKDKEGTESQDSRLRLRTIR
ncbi:hypothetical protein RHSIM_Rhsim07G0182900 [Rhododendron simsii]|uniref:DUF4283 domain-containing protein n=1 Tax=Rhododendron simsii TaxID=118357 RepID=A0A834LJ89_RHOSS|nr:hypothetical protein RHSIM_Rhsim07G0182900 [Rhododendron simsii]